MHRFLIVALGGLLLSAAAVVAGPVAADACAGLIGSNGAVNLGRTTTLAAYHDGVEHYVTAFQFLGGGGQFGTLIPLPGVPTKVERGGDWTLQRLIRETQPVAPAAVRAFAAQDKAGVEVLLQQRIDALDLTVLRGGAPDVAAWAADHGFRLSVDAPEVLDFYAQRSPVFLAAIFDGQAALDRGQKVGDGTPVHLTIPLDNPWVPLRVLALGKKPEDRVDADVFLLTDDRPALLPAPQTPGFIGSSPAAQNDKKPSAQDDKKGAAQDGSPVGLTLFHSAPATKSLLDDLRADKGMEWTPRSAWLTQVRIGAPASSLRYDLAVDASGRGDPSPVAAGLVAPAPVVEEDALASPAEGAVVLGLAAAAAVGMVAVRRRRLGA